MTKNKACFVFCVYNVHVHGSLVRIFVLIRYFQGGGVKGVGWAGGGDSMFKVGLCFWLGGGRFGVITAVMLIQYMQVLQ